ncbi:exocyst complex component 1-like [Mobula hypostoma]|uniref:exocyst complex component 1-like n=1 Tax=Mobula hypostoma TaxID=723540 RepID=UPI002FC305B4
MAALLRKELKKEVFHPNGDRLFAVIEVVTGEQEDERYYLCSSVTNCKEVQITFVKNMISSENEQFEKITTWYLEDLKLVDGKEANQDNPHFDMHFDKVYGWESSSTASKYTFVRCLQELNRHYLGKKITFVNFDADFLIDTSSNSRETKAEHESHSERIIKPTTLHKE